LVACVAFAPWNSHFQLQFVVLATKLHHHPALRHRVVIAGHRGHLHGGFLP
jgi:hypothetical protein